MSSKNVIDVNSETWDAEVIKSEIPVLVDFWGEWCGPCKMLAPIIEDLADEFVGQAKFVSVNVETNMELAKNQGVSSIPVLYIFNGGKKIDKKIGYSNKDGIKKFLEKNLEKK